MATRKGAVFTVEHREEISKALTGRVSHRKGKQLSKIHKERISQSLKGHVKTKEHIRRQAESLRGNKRSEYAKKKTVETRRSNGQEWHTEETKNKMSEKKKGKYMGEDSWLWQGGKSFEPYSPEFNKSLKKLIKEKKGYQCQVCGKYGEIIHHIDYDKKNSDIRNLTVVCRSCHSKTNFNRDYWIKFFKWRYK